MKQHRLLAVGMIAALLSACDGPSDVAPTQSEETNTTAAPSSSGTVLFEDSMMESWQDHWFLDGQNAVLEHQDKGLAFLTTASKVDKRVDRAPFDAQHANLWTKQEFEGDLRISYTYYKLPDSSWQKLVYIQARGIDEESFVEDIHAWRDERKVAKMDKYYKYMDLLSLSFRDQIRCKRYPTVDLEDKRLDCEFLPRADNKGLPNDSTFHVVIEKRKDSLSLKIMNLDTKELAVDHTWDLTELPARDPKHVTAGRIGIRHMGGQRTVIRDFKVEQL